MKSACDTRSILVVGGGIGGMAAAAALCQDERNVDIVGLSSPSLGNVDIRIASVRGGFWAFGGLGDRRVEQAT